MTSFIRVLSVALFISTLLLLSAQGAVLAEEAAQAEARLTEEAAGGAKAREPEREKVDTAEEGALSTAEPSVDATKVESIDALAEPSESAAAPEALATSARSPSETKEGSSSMFDLHQKQRLELEQFKEALPEEMSDKDAFGQIQRLQELFDKHAGERSNIEGTFLPQGGASGIETYLSEVSSFVWGRY